MKPEAIFTALAGLIIFTQLFAIGTLAYLGTFSRYLADDYCESASLMNEPMLSAVLHRYESGGSNRFSNLLFVGLAKGLGEHNIQILPALMLLIWLAGSVWLVHELRKLVGIRWPVIMDYLLAITIVFFSAWQTPNPFQTFLWRSGMATHFAPLVFMILLYAFIVYRINFATKPSIWVFLFIFLVSFLVGGFSEPPTVFLFMVLILIFPVVWLWENRPKRQAALNLLSSNLAGVMLAFLVMFFSPLRPSQGRSSFVYLLTAAEDTFRFTFNFMDNTIRTLPLPSLLSILTSFFIFFVFFLMTETQPLSDLRKRQIVRWIVLVPLIQYILIAASFAPSAWGESYPAERAQILGRVIMTVSFLLEGALLGVLTAHSRSLFLWRGAAFLFGSLIFFVLAFYPLRAGFSTLAEVPKYGKWTAAWDLRETEIHQSIAMGERDLVVRFLPTKGGVKELDATTTHWVNRCAAQYYNVDTIRSVPMGDQ